MASEKVCTRCGETKPLDEYHRNKIKADGRRSHCKECSLESARRYHEENRDKRLESARRYREENRDKVLEYKRRYYEDNRDILNQGAKIRQAQYRRTSNLLTSKKGAPYSPGEDALLLTNDGRNNYQKAIKLGRTYESVSSRLRELRKKQTQ